MPVLGTKLCVPTPRRELVARERLTERLRFGEGPAPRLVLIAAPAGFGKTTLMAQWARQVRGARTAWLSLDVGDAEVGRFLAHLVAAVQVVEPDVGAEVLGLLESEGSAQAEAAAVSLVNELDLMDDRLVLALDDYHVVDSTAVDAVVTFLLDNLPPQVTIAMTTRVDPALPLSRLRARGELVEVRAADLRFTVEESGAFLNDVMALDLDPALVSALGERTEGWAAGLQLAGLSVRGHLSAGRDDVAGFVDEFTGSHRLVLDYLVDEVVERQPDDVRDFLLDTCILDQLTADLCDAVTGRTGGRDLLETLERENLFLVALDDERRWFRYHHLFAEALRARLLAQGAARGRELHLAAAGWYAEVAMLGEAMTHALAAGHPDLAAELMELALPELSRQRQDRTLRERLRALPEEVVRQRALLASGLAWAHLTEGDLDGVDRWLTLAEAADEPMANQLDRARSPLLAEVAAARDVEARGVPAMISVYRAAAAQARGDVDGTVAHASRALELAGEDDHAARGAASGFLGLAAWAAGDPVTAVDTFNQAVRSLRAGGKVSDTLGATVVLADMWWARGRPEEARRLYEQALQAAEGYDGWLTCVGDLHVGLADALREAGELDSAAEHLQTAKEIGDSGSLLENRYRWYATMAALMRARGDLGGAEAMLDDAERVHLPGYFPHVHPIASARARIWITQGRLDRATTWVRDRGVTHQDTASFLAESEQLTLARLLVATGEATASLGMLDRVVADAVAADRGGSLVEARLVRALARDAVGDREGAADDLAAAVGVGVPVGYARLFLDEGRPVVTLLGRLAHDPAAGAQAHARRLLDLAETDKTSHTAPSVPLVGGALSERELEVLRLLDTELSGPEIARRLYVTVNTLRTHTKHVFTKLDVNTRRAAVRRARDLGIL
jgi:LuxR family maltose regulon positive regulatory protein